MRPDAAGAAPDTAGTPTRRPPNDRVLERHERRGWMARAAIVACLVLGVLGALLTVVPDATGRGTVERQRLTIASVSEEKFDEYIALTGTVEPIRSVFLDAVAGGRVEEVLVRDGAIVAAGQPLVRLSNDALRLQSLGADLQRVLQAEIMRSAGWNLDARQADLQQQLSEARHHLAGLESQRGSSDESATSERLFWTQREEALGRDLERNRQQLESHRAELEASARRMREYGAVVEQMMEQLVVRAPAAGSLSRLDARVGEWRAPGTRFGEIDTLDGFQVAASVDELYLNRVRAGATAEFDADGGSVRLVVRRVHPDVKAGTFRIELAFDGKPPSSIRRGQSARVRLMIGGSSRALVIPRAGFHRATGGSWIFVVDPSGSRAERRAIRLGRQNPRYFEVLDGLRVGERVIVSNYDDVANMQRLVLR